jgi:hypothetical protein
VSIEITVTVKHTRILKLPTLPNFIRDTKDEPVGIETLSEEQLREIGQKWTDALVRKARERKGDACARLNKAIAADRL